MPPSISPGITAAMNRLWIEVSVIRPYTIRTIEGGIMVPSEPPTHTVPIARFWL